jgi:hypothetical protein
MPLRAVITHEICLQSVGQERCELVVCAASKKYFPIAPALGSSDCHQSRACVFVSACLKIDFVKRLDFLKGGPINAQESAGNDLSYIRSPRNAACQQGFGRVLQTQVVFERNRINCMRRFGVSHYFAELDEMHMPLTLEHGVPLGDMSCSTPGIMRHAKVAKGVLLCLPDAGIALVVRADASLQNPETKIFMFSGIYDLECAPLMHGLQENAIVSLAQNCDRQIRGVCPIRSNFFFFITR